MFRAEDVLLPILPPGVAVVIRVAQHYFPPGEGWLLRFSSHYGFRALLIGERRLVAGVFSTVHDGEEYWVAVHALHIFRRPSSIPRKGSCPCSGRNHWASETMWSDDSTPLCVCSTEKVHTIFSWSKQDVSNLTLGILSREFPSAHISTSRSHHWLRGCSSRFVSWASYHVSCNDHEQPEKCNST